MQPTQTHVPTPPPMVPAPLVPWYHQKWFVVLALVFFFPVGLVLLWMSPATKMSGRVTWSIIVGLSFLVYISGGGNSAPATSSSPPATTGQSQPTSSTSGQTPPPPAAAPAPPKDEYPFKFTDKSSGTVYQGKIASSVGVAVVDVKQAKTVGTNQFARHTASDGATYVVVRVAVNNEQRDAIMMSPNQFKILANGREYSASTEAMTAIMVDEQESFFLKQINPGLVALGTVAFEVPETLNLESATLQFQGGFTGRSETVPLRPVTR
jgi:hypothetical protein